MKKTTGRRAETELVAHQEAGGDRDRESFAPRRRGAAGMLAASLLSTSTFALSIGTAAAAPDHAGPASPPVGNAFPVPAPHDVSFSDDWHACRDDCARFHKGNDIFANEGASVVAVEPGVIAKVDNTDDSNAGQSIWLVGDSGVAYFYAHNSANFVTVGQRVARGQLIGRVGRTGNARTTPPHIHFQVNVCGELTSDEPCTVDPYPYIRSWAQGQIDGGADAVGLHHPTRGTADLRIEGGSARPPVAVGTADANVIAVAGDWDGDGRDTLGLYDRERATFAVDGAAGGSSPIVFATAGATDAVPVAGDWDGDGRDTLGVYRRSDATFLLDDGTGASLPPILFGSPAAVDVIPVAGDWDGDGRDGVGLYSQQTGTFELRDDEGADLPSVAFGPAGSDTLPLAGDWDGDGRETVGIFERRTGAFDLSGPDAADPATGASTIQGTPDGNLDAYPVAGDWNGEDLVTVEDLRAIFGPFQDEAVAANLPLLNTAMRNAGITTPARKAAFLATIHNESGFDAEAIEPSDSPYRGRGFIQLTGHSNYRDAGTDLGVDLEDQPDLAANPLVSPAAAAWYWTVARDINYAADRLDMAAVNIAIGYRPSAEEDTQRCDDFRRALAWFNGGQLPEEINCDRSLATTIPPRPIVVTDSPARSNQDEGPGAEPEDAEAPGPPEAVEVSPDEAAPGLEEPPTGLDPAAVTPPVTTDPVSTLPPDPADAGPPPATPDPARPLPADPVGAGAPPAGSDPVAEAPPADAPRTDARLLGLGAALAIVPGVDVPESVEPEPALAEPMTLLVAPTTTEPAEGTEPSSVAVGG